MNKILFIVLILSLHFQIFSQEQKSSLLWEIKHEKSQKTSYLYGTMHISGKLAFHLGEEFFEAIQSTDAVALESNPIIWLDEIFNSPYASDYLGKYGFEYQTYKGFYQEAFKITIPDNKNLSNAISNDHYLSNWMLYRENKSKIDFEEDTFLDLFIYQAGTKNKKPVYSLEDFSQTTHFSKMGSMPDKEKKEFDAWYEKMTEKKNAYDLIQDAYRNKNIFLLDSLHSQINSVNFIKYMLEIRNQIMADKIDSLILKENTSLFIGIGAAHLAGNVGVIEMLKEKGYSLRPVPTTIKDDTKLKKEAFDKKKVKIEYNKLFESDLFSVKIPGSMYETPTNAEYQRQFFSPELTNGAYFQIKLISTYAYLSLTNQNDYLEKIDSILFESIPGDIVQKKSINKNGFKGIDVINKTKTGNFQRYQFYLTPLNLFIFKMGGKDSFVSDFGDGFFNSILLKEVENNWVNFTPLKNDFEVNLPNYNNIKGNTKITSLYNHIEIEAYDKTDESFYFIKRNSLHDSNYIEEDEFELNRLAKMFFKNIEIDTFETNIIEDSKFPTALAYAQTKDSNYIALKIIIRGPFYYLLGNVSNSYKESNVLFDSFKFNVFKYQFEFKEIIDSAYLFKVNSNYLNPNIYDNIYLDAEKIRSDNLNKVKEDNSFKSFNINRYYYSENYERIIVNLYKFHDYAEYENIDSLWSSEIRLFSKKNSLVTHSKKSYTKNDYHFLDAEFSDTNSCRIILTKYILKEGLLYTLITNIDTIEKPSKFIETFFNTFEPLDTTVGKSIFEDKSKMFLKNIYSEDSLTKEHAFESIKTYIKFDDEDVEEMFNVINNYKFSEKHIEVKSQMISDLGKIDDKRIIPFLVDLYPKVQDTAMYQIAILKALGFQKSKKSYETFVKLLEQDVPLSSNKWGSSSLYYPFYDSLELSKYIFPNILNFTFIEEYKSPTYNLLAHLVSENKIKGKEYSKNYSQILREAKIELKSQISFEQSEATKKSTSYNYNTYKNKGNNVLVNYSIMLIPFYNKSNVQEFFLRLYQIKDLKVKTDIFCELTKKNIKLPNDILNELAEDLVNRNYLFEKLSDIKRPELFPEKYKNQNLMIESLLYNSNFNLEKDSMQFISKHLVTVKDNSGYVYFYKSKKEKDDDWELDYAGIQPENLDEINIDKTVFEKGKKIEKHKTIDEIINEYLESIEIIGRPRAKVFNNNSNEWDFWFY